MATVVRQLRVLLVEDEDDHADLIQLRLSRAGGDEIHIERVTTLASALQAIREQEIDAVLLDLNLPDSTGIETCYELCDVAPEVPVIVLTSLEIAEQGKLLVRERAEDYLPKDDLNGELVLRAVQCAIERHDRRAAEFQLRHHAGMLEAARKMQTALLPSKAPDIPGFDVAFGWWPAEIVAGDYFDFIQQDDGHYVFAIGDAVGHGPGAALVMSLVAGGVRTALQHDTDLGVVVTSIHSMLRQQFSSSTFMTLLLTTIDPVSRTFTYCSAGHPHGYVYDNQGEYLGMLEEFNQVPAGIAHDAAFRESPTIEIVPGGMLLLVSDGVTETGQSRGPIFGEARLHELVKQNIDKASAEIVEQIRVALLEYRDADPPADDATVVAFRSIK